MPDEKDHPHSHPEQPQDPRQPVGDVKLQTPPEPGSTLPSSEIDDTESRALSEALRSSFVFVKLIMVILVVVFFASGVFTVPPQESAIIFRFGKAVGQPGEQLLDSGLHWAFPYPIDEVVRIPLTRLQSVQSTTGWYNVTPEQELAGVEPMAMPGLNPAVEGYTLTGDGNIIHVRATLKYRIHKPVEYAFKFVNSSNVVQNLLDNALYHASARFTVDDALRLQLLAFKDTILTKVQQEVDELDLGITIEELNLRTREPLQVKQEFELVSQAEVERRQAIDEAEGYANRALSSAQGEAARLVNLGSTDRNRLVEAIRAEARYFQDQLPYYEDNKELFLARIQADALHRVLTNGQDKIFIPQRADGKTRELRLQLSREPEEPKFRSRER